MEDNENNRKHTLMLRCPKCDYKLQVLAAKSDELMPVDKRIQYIVPIEEDARIAAHGTAVLIEEVTKRGWSIFAPVTPDIGIDYLVAKEHAVAMIQLKTATQMSDARYHVTLKKFPEGPLGFVIYYFVGDKTFFIVPFAEFWEIPRFKALKEKVFAFGQYNDTMSLKTAKEVMGDYENENGWQLLERLTTVEGLLKVVKDFVDRHKRG